MFGIRFVGVITFTLVLAFHLGGCFEPAPDDSGDEDSNFIETNLTDPHAVLDSFEKAFNTKNLEAYAALLDEEFLYCPLEEDAEDFPWLAGDCWDKATELEGISMLFDPSYAGPPHPLFGDECAVTELQTRNLSEVQIELTCTAQGRVFSTANDGWSFDSRVIFTLVNRGGFWRIWRLTEIDTAGNVGGSPGGIAWEPQ